MASSPQPCVTTPDNNAFDDLCGRVVYTPGFMASPTREVPGSNPGGGRCVTAVDASEVLDIMLSDYPHKYEEYRAHQRARQLTEPPPPPAPPAPAPPNRADVKAEPKTEQKHDAPKVDPEKTRQDLAAAAIASAMEWNARLNALRRPACADLQTMALHTRRAPRPGPPATHLRPPAGFYPHALLPGQYQHSYRRYTADHLRCGYVVMLEWTAVRRPACADLQTMALHTRRAPRPGPPATHLRPPAASTARAAARPVPALVPPLHCRPSEVRICCHVRMDRGATARVRRPADDGAAH
ncbi:hypothetical protein evm_015150 [Chilo suppressalis]|nr:hypothetical protein evm_015150 [Chilo suppressalis]